jgi:hypothetical protein
MILRNSKKVDIKPTISSMMPSFIFGIHERVISVLKKPLFIQTTIGLISHVSKNKIIVTYSTLDLKNQIFLSNIKQVINNIQQSIQFKIHPIYQEVSIDDKIVFSFYFENTLALYDTCGNKQTLLHKNLFGKFCDLIIHISKIKYFYASNQGKKNLLLNVHIVCNVIQIREHNNVISNVTSNESMFLENIENIESNKNIEKTLGVVDEFENVNIGGDTFISHYIYGVYFRMLEKKVPKNAVKQKILMDNRDPNILNYISSDIVPARFEYSESNETNEMNSILNYDRTNLKKTDPLKNKFPKLFSGINLGISLEAIQKRLSTLKKIQ